jgi:hypothetical protein
MMESRERIWMLTTRDLVDFAYTAAELTAYG